MSTAFLCGNIDEEFFSRYNITGFINIVKSIIEENGIERIYHCKRTFFDIKLCSIISFFNPEIEIIELRDIHKNDFEYCLKNNRGLYKILCPFKNEIENSKLYQTLYDYAIESSDILIAYSKFDDDISHQIIKKANEKGKTVINVAKLI